MIDYFSTLFTFEEGEAALVLACLDTRISEEQNALLLQPVSGEGVKVAVFIMHPDKSPGPDGLSPAVFQIYWEVVGNDVVLFCQNFLSSGLLPPNVNDTHIVLIPKLLSLEITSDFRHVSLCNVIYRILAKVLANRLRGLLNSVISSAQSAFIPGCSIVDNILIAFESSHALNRHHGDMGGFGALKVDMSKAYDRVEWGFLSKVLLGLGFSTHWVHFMKECVSKVHYKILV